MEGFPPTEGEGGTATPATAPCAGCAIPPGGWDARGAPGSHQPLDSDIHGEGRNLLNRLPRDVRLLLVGAVIALLPGSLARRWADTGDGIGRRGADAHGR